MNVYSKLEEITNYIKKDMSDGVDINTAVKNRTKGQNNELIKRAIEEINTDISLENILHGDDKAKEFDLADPKTVFGDHLSETFDKSDIEASNIKQAALDTDEFYTRKIKEKTSAFSLPCGEYKGLEPTKDLYWKKYSSDKETNKRTLEKINSLYVDCKKNIINLSLNLKKHLEKNSSGENEEFFSKLNTKYDKSNSDANKALSMICKLSGKNPGKFEKFAGFFDEDEDVIYFDDLVYNVGALRKLGASGYKKQFKKLDRAEEAKFKGLSKGLDIIKQNLPEKRYLEQVSRVKSQYDKSNLAKKDLAKSEKKKKYNEKAWANAEKTFADGTDLITGIPGQIRSGLENVMLKMKPLLPDAAARERALEDMKKDLVTQEDTGKNIVDKFKQKYVFLDLAHNDEILKDQDVSTLSVIFQTIASLAPRVAANKELMRSVMRRMSSQVYPTVDEHYVLQLKKMDGVLGGIPKDQIKL